MYNLNRDHPAIEMAEATGYPNLPHEEECHYCGRPATWELDGTFYCDDCALDEAMQQITDKKDIEEICDFVGMIAI